MREGGSDWAMDPPNLPRLPSYVNLTSCSSRVRAGLALNSGSRHKLEMGLMTCFNDLAPAITQLHAGLLYKDVVAQAERENHKQCPEPVERVAGIEVQTGEES